MSSFVGAEHQNDEGAIRWGSWDPKDPLLIEQDQHLPQQAKVISFGRMFGALSSTATNIGGVVSSAAASLSCWLFKRKPVELAAECGIREELEAGLDEIQVDADGQLVVKVGVAKLIAERVWMRFGETPKLRRAEWLVAARYVNEEMDKHGITRHKDRVYVFSRARALVFVQKFGDKDSNKILNSSAVAQNDRDATGWGHYEKDGMFGWLYKGPRAMSDQ